MMDFLQIDELISKNRIEDACKLLVVLVAPYERDDKPLPPELARRIAQCLQRDAMMLKRKGRRAGRQASGANPSG